MLACTLLACSAALLLAAPAASQTPGRKGILVVQVEGLLDAPNVSLVKDSIADVNRRGLTMLLLQLDSKGAIEDVGPLVRAIGRSRVPVVVWVGPSGAEARGGAVLVAEAAHVLFVSNGSDIGPGDPVRLDDPGASTRAGVARQLVALATTRGRTADGARRLAEHSLSSSAAARVGASNGVRPTVGETIVTLNGKSVTTAGGARRLSTAKVIGKGRDRRRQPNQDVVFKGLDIGGQVQHSLISPAAAYFLFVVGLALAVFEFFAASVGFAALVGALSIVGGMYGFSHLPVHWWGVGLLLLATLGFAIDAQSGGSRFWSVTGGLALVGGSVFLYGGSSELRPAWWVLLLVVLGTVLFYVTAVPSFLRARFSTPTIGREAMIGEMGTAEVAVDPDGVVLVRDGRWRARTNRATPIAAGDPIRVVAVEGLVLEVEPEVGGARDHRDRARRAKR